MIDGKLLDEMNDERFRQTELVPIDPNIWVANLALRVGRNLCVGPQFGRTHGSAPTGT
jgi:hypothetical protein